jgi:hypothetical protein
LVVRDAGFDPSVRDFARGTLKEIQIFGRTQGCYGWVFYVLERLPAQRAGEVGPSARRASPWHRGDA